MEACDSVRPCQPLLVYMDVVYALLGSEVGVAFCCVVGCGSWLLSQASSAGVFRWVCTWTDVQEDGI